MQLPLLTRRHALFLDFDGTLVDLAARPDEIRPDPQLLPLLEKCVDGLEGAVAILTGRRLESIDHFLTPLKLAGAGLHGVQRRETPEAPIVEHENALQLPASLPEDLARYPGLLLEEKGPAIAIHFREAPAFASKALDLLRRVAAANGHLELIEGKFVYEVRPRDFDKGGALHAFMQRRPFEDRLPVFVGDDTTDEDAFRAAQSMGGFGIKVGPGESVARFRLVDPQAVLIWLHQAVQSLAAPATV